MNKPILRFTLILIMGQLLIGCAIFRGAEPKPEPLYNADFYIEEGDKSWSKGDLSRAIELYKSAIEKDPKSIEARRKLAEAYAKQGDKALALDEFAKILEIDPNYVHAYNFRGFIYSNQKDWDKAIKEFESALKLDPNNIYALNHLGLVYKMTGKIEDAKNILQKAVELDPQMEDPESKNTHNFLGLLYKDEGNYESAIAEYLKTLEHFPDDTVAHNRLGEIYELMGKYGEAIEEYRKVLSVSPEDEFAKSKLSALQQAGIIDVPPVEIVKDDIDQYISNAPDASEYPSASAIILLDKLSYEILDDGRLRYTVHWLIKIFNDRGVAEFGEISMPFNSKTQNIGVNIARTIFPDGTYLDAAEDAYHDITFPGLAEYNLYSDIMLKIVSMPALQPGVILEYKATVEDAQVGEKSWLWGSMSFQSMEPALISKCALRVPKNLEIKWKLQNCQIEPVIVEDGDSLTYIWISKNNPEIAIESAMPPLEDVVPLLVFSSNKSWDEVYKWYKDLSSPQEQADPAIKQKVAELIAGKSTREERIKAIFEFVASEIRYVAIELGQSAYQPTPAPDVFRYRYGDCKDKVTLLNTMLREAGIDAYQALISPAPNKTVDPEIPSIAQFSHVITAVPLEEGGYIWLDPTIPTCKYGDLPAGDQGRKAFVIGEDHGIFVDTPIHPPEANKITLDSEITVSEDGTVHGWERTIAKGQADMYLKAVYRLIKPDKIKEFLESAFNQRYPGVQIDRVFLSDLYDLDTPIEIKVDFSCRKYIPNLEGTLIFPLPGEEFSDYAALVGTSRRRYDIHLGYNMSMEKALTLSLPEGYRANILPEDISINHEFGSFVRRYEGINDSTIRYFTSLNFKTSVISSAHYNELKNMMETAAKEDKAQIILMKPKV